MSGGYNNKGGNKTKIFNVQSKNTIEKNILENVYYIEATYIENKPYVLLSGYYYSESYEYKNGDLKFYKSKNNENEKKCSFIINLFKDKYNKIYLISDYENRSVTIFDFNSTDEKFSIKLGNSLIYGLCQLNKQYFLVGDNKEIKVIDFDKESVIKSYDKDIK